MANLSSLPSTSIYNAYKTNKTSDADIEALKGLLTPGAGYSGQDTSKAVDIANTIKSAMSLAPNQPTREPATIADVFGKVKSDVQGTSVGQAKANIKGAIKQPKEAAKSVGQYAKSLWNEFWKPAPPPKDYGPAPRTGGGTKAAPTPPQEKTPLNLYNLESIVSPARANQEDMLNSIMTDESRSASLQKLRDDLMSRKPKYDISPLLGFLGKGVGVDLVSMYNKPRTREDNQMLATQIDNLIEDRRKNNFDRYMKLRDQLNTEYVADVNAVKSQAQNYGSVSQGDYYRMMATEGKLRPIDDVGKMLKNQQQALENRKDAETLNVPAKTKYKAKYGLDEAGWNRQIQQTRDAIHSKTGKTISSSEAIQYMIQVNPIED